MKTRIHKRTEKARFGKVKSQDIKAQEIFHMKSNLKKNPFIKTKKELKAPAAVYEYSNDY